MNKKSSLVAVFATVVLGISLLNACRQTKDIEPAAEFAPYISAYSGGLIGEGSNLAVELTTELTDEQITKMKDKKLFSFTPSVKGATHWINNRTVEFIPEEGELKPGTQYEATFALGEVLKVENKLSKFSYSFRVDEGGYVLEFHPFELGTDNKVNIRGSIAFNKGRKSEDVKKMFSAKLGKEKIAPVIEGDDGATSFQILFSGMPHLDVQQLLVVNVDGAPCGIEGGEKRTLIIPPKDKFSLHEYSIVASPDYGLLLTFSNLVSESQNIKSMIVLKDMPSYNVQVKGNNVMVYFSKPKDKKTLDVIIDQGLKSAEGERLGGAQELSLTLEMSRPKIEMLTSGVIMPTSDKVLLPFRTVALRAFDLKIIQVYESNILMYLQDNEVNSEYHSSLRRAARLVYRRTIRLDNDPSKDLLAWENHTLDLTKFIKHEPGAIYRVELSFKQPYAVYECENTDSSEALSDAVDLTSILDGENQMTDGDIKYWDTPYTYYSGDYDVKYDWSQYEWGQRENPCHPTYYMVGENTTVATNVLVSNIGMIAKSNGETYWLAVSNLLDTKPMAEVDVAAYNFQLQKIGAVRTDAQGFAVMSLKSKPFVFVATSGAQKAYLRVKDGDENMLSRFDVGGMEVKKGLKGYVYGERGVWRPGDTLYLAFMLEDRDKKIPASHPVSLELFTPRGQFYKKLISTAGTNGLYTFEVPTKAEDQTGVWNAYVKVGGATFYKALRIETVKPNRLKINLDLPIVIDASKPAPDVAIHSQWLTGAVANGLDAKMELALYKTESPFKGYDGYVFSNPAVKFESATHEVFVGKLNERGDVSFKMPVPAAKNAPGMLRAIVTGRVFEPGGDASVFSQGVLFSPYSSYVGINFHTPKDGSYFNTDEDNVFDVVTLTSDGKPIGRSGLEYSVYRIDWSWWWESQNESFDSYVNNTNYKPVLAGTFNTVGGKGNIKLRINYPSWGRYLVYVKDPQSGHATGGTVFVDWPSWRGRSKKDGPDGVKMLSFSTDKEAYRVGETVTVTIPQTASDGRALMAFENGSGVVHREWVRLTAGEDTKYTFTVTKDMAPNIYLHVSLLQPHASAIDLPIRMYGVRPIFVTNDASRLEPLITVADVLRPETDFEVKVKEKNGKPMTYTLTIVDDGLLDLTNFKTPNPWDEFYAREALGVRTWDLYDDVMGAYAGKFGSLFAIGGDTELNKASAKANRFKPVVLYDGPVTLSAGSTKTHKLKLPPYVGSVRVMVVAGQDGAYGSAEKTSTVRSPLMLLSSLPRVLGTDEEIMLPINVFAMEDGVKNVTVKVETTGKLNLSEGNQQTVTFSKPGDEIVYFKANTGGKTGIEKVTVTASGGGHTSKEVIEIDVRNPNPPVISSIQKLLEKGQSADFEYELLEEADDNWVKVEMSTIPSIDISRRLDFLYEYTHYCTEQLTSRAMPLLYISDLKDVDTQEEKSIKTNIAQAIGNLYKRQLSDGGFEYWEGNGYAMDWATSYAGHFLVLAKERGFSINKTVLERWKKYQKTAAQNWNANVKKNRRYANNQSDVEQAYRLYTLALAGSPDMGSMNRLKANGDLSVQAKWRLAAAYAICGKKDVANELVFKASTTIEPYASNNSTFGSSLRDESMILEALLLMDKKEEAFKQAQKVSRRLTGESGFSTQSTAYAIVAMAQLSQSAGKPDFEWSLNGKKQDKVKGKKSLYQKQLPTNPLSGNVQVSNGNVSALYVSVASKSRPLVDNNQEIAENLRIEVRYYSKGKGNLDVRDIQQGEDFYAIVKVSNISGANHYTDLALTHIIPSGWEIVNERMTVASATESVDNHGLKVFDYQDVRDDRVLTYFDLPSGSSKEFKVRLQATYLGGFVLPAIVCEAMYDPSVYARTKASRTTVTK